MSENLQRLGVIALLLYIGLIGGTYFSEFYLFPAIVFQIVVTGVLAAWLIHLLARRRSWPRTPFDAVLGIYALWLLITTLLSHDPRVSLEGIWRFLAHLAGFYLLVDLMRRGRQRWIMEALSLSAGAVVMISAAELLSWYFGLGLGGFTQGWFTIGGGLIPPAIHRLTLALNNSTVLANYVALVLPVFFCWGLSVSQRDYRIGLFLLCVGLLGVEALALSRGGWLATLAAGAALSFFWLYRWSARSARFPPKVVLPLAATGFLLALLLVLWIASAVRGTSLIDQDEGRLDLWRGALEMTRDRPLTGFGVRQFGAGFRDYRDPSIEDNQLAAAHNLWLNVSAETGLPGLTLLFWVGAVFLREWRRAWQVAPPGGRLRLEGILAALIGLCVNSLVDAFALTASVLPVLIFSAYTVAGRYSPNDQAAVQPPTWLSRALRPAALGLVFAYFGWFAVIDLAHFQMLRSIQFIAKDDLDGALEHAERARDLDPQLGLYRLHYAYVLGLLAEDQPDQYLDRAIEAHEDSLSDYPTFDIGQANLAALYRQQGDYADAVRSSRMAVDNNSYKTEYHLLLGQLLEEQALAEGRDPAESGAIAAYREALKRNLKLALSAFWDESPLYTARRAALEAYFEDAPSEDQLLLAVYRRWTERAAGLNIEGQGEDEAAEAYALASYAFTLRQDYAQAVDDYTRAIERADSYVDAYVGRAEAYYHLGDFDAAERDARTALFLDPLAGARANYVLALIELDRRTVPPDDQAFNRQLIAAVEPRVQVEYFAQVVFLRPAAFDYVPQLNTPGRDADYYAPWFLLAERYAADDDPDTDPADVYEAILRRDPYVQAARDRLDRSG